MPYTHNNLLVKKRNNKKIRRKKNDDFGENSQKILPVNFLEVKIYKP